MPIFKTKPKAPALPDQLNLTATPEIQAAAGDKPARVSILAYTGGEMVVSGFGPIVIGLAGMDVPDSVPLLGDHDNRLQGVAGTGQPTVRDDQLLVAGTLTGATEAGQAVLALAKDGVSLQASVGAQPLESRAIPKGQSVEVNGQTITAGRSGLTLVSKSRLREVTITPIGADGETSVAIAAKKGATTMAKATALPTDTHDDAILAERTRLKTISATLDDAASFMQAADVARLREQAFDGEVTIEELQGTILRSLRASRSQAPSIGSTRLAPGVQPNDVLEAALMVRAGYSDLAEKEFDERVMESSREFTAMSFVELCRAALQANGVQAPQSRSEIIAAAFGPAMIQASGPSTFSIPTALGNTVNRAMIAAYKDSPATWRSFCRIERATDFKDHKAIRPSFVGKFEEVGADGEIKSRGMKEATYNWSIDTFGDIMTVTRQDLVNDDLGFIETAVRQMGPVAARKLADLVYESLLAAGSSYFDATLKNLGTAVLSVDNLGFAIEAIRLQVDAEDNNLDIQPATLLVPPELESIAKAALDSEFTETIASTTAEVRPTGNPQRKSVALEVEPRLSNTAKFANANTLNWFLFARESDAPMIVGFLEGMQAPKVEFFGLDHQANRLVVSWRAYQDFGVSLGDYRAAYKAAVV